MKSFRNELWFNTPDRVGFINITPEVERCLEESGVREGLVLVNAMHITASVFINDDEGGLHHDYSEWLERLAPHEPPSPLFWDPAGLFGQPAPGNGAARGILVPRHNDVIWKDAPTLPTYWQFAETTGDTAMEVLEWALSDAQAEQLYDALVKAAQPDGSAAFSTATSEPLCAIAVSRFLHRFGGALVEVDESYFLPANLAETLRPQNPDSVIVFASGQPPREFLIRNNRS